MKIEQGEPDKKKGGRGTVGREKNLAIGKEETDMRRLSFGNEFHRQHKIRNIESSSC